MEDPVRALEFPAQRALMASDESRPCSPSGDEYPLVPSSFATAQIPPDLLDRDEVDSLQGDELGSVRGYGYHSSASSMGHSSDVSARDLEDEKLLRGPSPSSSHSSVSSIPPSALVHSSNALKSPRTAGTRQHTYRRSGTFRRQNSVPSIQIHSDDESDEYETSWRGGGQRRSEFSMRSPASPSMKRLPYYSPRGSASKQSIKREYPLVLLHCNLLPPSLPVIGYTGVPNQKILKEVLPTKYYRRWKLLEEKVGSGVLRDRGVLISHPEDTYDLLEERLLESLELQQPRLHHGHFLRQQEYDSDRDDGATDDEQGEVCTDCGGRVVTCNDQNRKWEIKVFAANGLMRAGAWAAAWKEMEKVDVEVGLWLPGDVRRELERRLLEDEVECKLPSQLYKQHSEMSWGSRPPSVQEEARSPLTERSSTANDSSLYLASPPASQEQEQVSSNLHNRKSAAGIDLRTLLINYIRVLASDRRNIAIGILSIFVVFLAIAGARVPASTSSSELQVLPQETVASVPTSVVSMEQHRAASADTSSVLRPIPTSVADEWQVPPTEEKGTASSQASYSEMPTTSSELVPASMPTEAEWQDHVVVDDTSAQSLEAIEQPDTEPQEASVSVDQPEELMVESMEENPEEASDLTQSTNGEFLGKEVDVQIESLRLTGSGESGGNTAENMDSLNNMAI
ncbi:uncharacterized protein ASPGLDRAFT_42776 [Aspergillus glaucus CBS 516.65]|uniref:Flavoprotein oxygenase n=1 Tax=Aspergillus glaucus CBS 516.65 TaxID=1160497 RepID=A0A1L9VUZ4_ASPGL|nr:hypothetical protein ASPGLDRAFT_42776 [Aspergillus glaucus CBS 516.65]OJJ87720.1 hypothetical protein ASPGLDRAFT_42776 [Aspergillus glaucus CBS 516.65]